jgi:hypothetical protein
MQRRGRAPVSGLGDPFLSQDISIASPFLMVPPRVYPVNVMLDPTTDNQFQIDFKMDCNTVHPAQDSKYPRMWLRPFFAGTGVHSQRDGRNRPEVWRKSYRILANDMPSLWNYLMQKHDHTMTLKDENFPAILPELPADAKLIPIWVSTVQLTHSLTSLASYKGQSCSVGNKVCPYCDSRIDHPCHCPGNQR